MTPSGVAWPAGLNYDGGITYDCQAHTIDDHQGGGYGLDSLGPEYIDGTGWNGTGFPSFEVMQFVDNSTPRPDTFCGEARGDVYGSDAYNAAWSNLLTAVGQYEAAHGWEDKGYYYVQNEPQDQADYDVAAFLANLSKTAAPNLRIAISEEPKPEIAENPKAMGHSYDLWWADLSNFEPVYAKTRQALGETVWWYFLYGDLPPYFNPITIDHSGIESRIPFWGAWKYRVKGFAYYSVTGWGSDPVSNPRPMGTNQNGDGFLLYPPNADGLVTSIRWELLREGAEDYEYLLLAAGGSAPLTSDTVVGCDATVASAVSSTTAYTRDTAAFQHLRDELGAMLGGEANGCPALDSQLPGSHPRAAYYINFQDPNGEPSASPLVVDGHTWTKIGWEAYDPNKGYGWAGPYIGDDTIMLYSYQSDGSGNELQKSIIYDDYGRTDTFNWDIANGQYKVTVGIGWDGGNSYPKNKVVVEGQTLFDEVTIDGTTPYREASVTVDVEDGNVTMEVGEFNEYTMLNYMSDRARAVSTSLRAALAASAVAVCLQASSAAAQEAPPRDVVDAPKAGVWDHTERPFLYTPDPSVVPAGGTSSRVDRRALRERRSRRGAALRGRRRARRRRLRRSCGGRRPARARSRARCSSRAAASRARPRSRPARSSASICARCPSAGRCRRR